jgi:hypothetical protein
VNYKMRWINSFCLGCFLFLIFSQNVFAGLTEAERTELDRLQRLVENNIQLSEEQTQRWEELLLKDPDNLKKIRQKEIDKWADDQRAQGKEIDRRSIERQEESQWQDFLKQKDKRLVNLNENNLVVFLRQVRDVFQVITRKAESYPRDLNALILKYPEIIDSGLYAKIKKVYSIRYEQTNDSYHLWAFPLNPGTSGSKNFLLNNQVIFFTIDGSTPTPESNRIL